MGTRKRTINTFITLGLVGAAIVLLAKGNQKFDILGSLTRGLGGIPTAFASGIREGVSGVVEQTGSDPSSRNAESEQQTLNFNANKTQIGTGTFNLSGFTGFTFGSLQDFITKNVSLRPNEIVSFNPVRATTRTGTSLFVSAASAVDTGEVGIRNLPLAQRAISRGGPTLIGSFSTVTGGTRQIRGSAALFDRLAQNLG